MEKEQFSQPTAFRMSVLQRKRFEAVMKREDRQPSDMLRRVFEAGLKVLEKAGAR